MAEVKLPPTQTASFESAPPKKAIRKITGKVKIRKKPLVQRLASSLFQDNIGDIQRYLFEDALIPGLKNSILDVQEMLFFGEVRGRRRGGSSAYYGDDFHNYGGYFKSQGQKPKRQAIAVNQKPSPYDICVPSRAKANEILDIMQEAIIQYGNVSVNDLYGMVGITGSWTDADWGWTDLSTALIRHTRNGYLLELPPIVNIK